MDARRAGARVLSAVLALGAAGCHRRPPQAADAGPTDGVADGVETDDTPRCGSGVSDDLGFTVEGLSESPGIAYLGNVLVDESTPTILALKLLDVVPRDAGDRPRVTLRGASAPALPVGRIAWLTYGVSNGDTFGFMPSPWALIVRDVEGGTILFGTAHQHPGELFTPFPIGALTSLCSFGDCPRTTELALTVPGASPAAIPNGGTATLTIGTNAYRLGVHAEAQTFAFDQCDAATFVPPLPLVLTYVAKDLAVLAAGLAAPTQ